MLPLKLGFDLLRGCARGTMPIVRRIADLAAAVEGHVAWGIPAAGIQDILERHKTNNPDLFRLTDVIAADGRVLATTAPGHLAHDSRS